MSKSAYTNWKAQKDEEITLYFSAPQLAATLTIKSPSSLEITVCDGEKIHKVIKNTSSEIVVSGYEIRLKPLNGNAEGSFYILGRYNVS
jgi:hypothetical protein